MNPTELSDRLHAADEIEVDHVDAIIAAAVRQGQHRRRIRQRAVPALIGVVALATALGLAGILAVRDGRSSEPVATTSPPAPTASPSPVNPLTSADALAVVRAHLPVGMTATERGLWGDPQADRLEKQKASVLMTLEDGDGPARAQAGLYTVRSLENGRPGTGCTREGHCRRIRVDGKTFIEYTDWKGRGKDRHYDVGTYYLRSDGLFTGFLQHNFVDHGGPVTRPPLRGRPEWPVTGPTLPLSQAEVRVLLTAPEWDALAPRCERDLTGGDC
jgi:hypothetical protein